MNWKDDYEDRPSLFGCKYYLDLEELYSHVSVSPPIPDGVNKLVEEAIVTKDGEAVIETTKRFSTSYGGEVNTVKYEMIMQFIDWLIQNDPFLNDDDGDVDSIRDFEDRISNQPFSYQVVVNTLIKHNILKKTK